MEHLLPSFVTAAAGAGASAGTVDLEGAGMDLLRRWSEPHRGYHDVEHLGEVLDRLDDLRCGEPAPRLGAWFHDAVYRGAPGEDERASAELAVAELTALGVPRTVADRVAALVRMTAGHQPPPGDAGSAALCDADLAILTADEDRYRRYVQGVRREYRHLDDEAFRAGRAEVLRSLLGRPTLFSTQLGRRQWEGRARANLAAELSGLTG